MFKKIFASLVLLSSLVIPVQAKTYFQDFSVTYLHGNEYKVGAKERSVVTLEYVHVASWGDLFFFADRLNSTNGDHETYSEFQPRFLVKSFANDSVLKGLYVATQWESSTSADNYLVGLGMSFNVPSFQVLDLNLYRRYNEDYGDNYQLTAVWALPFANKRWLFDGYADFTNSVGSKAAITNIAFQLKYDIRSVFGSNTPVYVGLEYDYWKNKFGINGVDENNPNLLIKYHF